MNGEMAQIISLVAYGNLFLRGGDVDLSRNSTFQYVSSVKFARYKSNQDTQGIEIANSVPDWFTFLRSVRVSRLWNIAFAWQRNEIPEHNAAAFSNGVPTAIQADLPNGYELWYPQWNFDSQEKKWFVEYRSLIFPNSHVLPAQSLDNVKRQLKRAVSRAEAFAKHPDVNEMNWANWFSKSLELLDSANPNTPFHSDMLPDSGYSLEARQILASAAQADVFGGMGSWNDLGFEKQEIFQEYEKVTTELYDAVKFALVMASNSFAQ